MHIFVYGIYIIFVIINLDSERSKVCINFILMCFFLKRVCVLSRKKCFNFKLRHLFWYESGSS